MLFKMSAQYRYEFRSVVAGVETLSRGTPGLQELPATARGPRKHGEGRDDKGQHRRGAHGEAFYRVVADRVKPDSIAIQVSSSVCSPP